ncbi:MAG: YebC/PmpR family DNA-binding transcriptional regulator [Myxococcales bacterium]|nr:YebC/PmpR family DNA-binding transcriptional regulator [Myxococcales bacterium]
MSGHSKWSTIKHKKGAADARRGKLFSRLSKEVSIAARMGGGDPNFNSRLRTAIAAAKAANMPADNISRAVKKGTGEIEGAAYEETTYEGYAPGGVAVFVEITTDNRNRTASDVRHIFAKNHGNLGQDGCVAWIFEKKGQIIFEKGSVSEERLMEAAIEAGADDVVDGDEGWEVLTPPDSFHEVLETLQGAGLEPARAELTRIPQNSVSVNEKEAAQVLRLMEALEEHDDVQQVYANFDISDEVMQALA